MMLSLCVAMVQLIPLQLLNNVLTGSIDDVAIMHASQEDVPCAPGLSIYAITKACGHVCTQVYAANTPALTVLNVIWNG